MGDEMLEITPGPMRLCKKNAKGLKFMTLPSLVIPCSHTAVVQQLATDCSGCISTRISAMGFPIFQDMFGKVVFCCQQQKMLWPANYIFQFSGKSITPKQRPGQK